MENHRVVVGAGTLRHEADHVVRLPHRWTPEGVTVEAVFSGAHLLHLAVAGCVLNDVYREVARTGIDLRGVRVTATGGFDEADWRSTGIGYEVELDGPSVSDARALLAVVEAVAEIRRALRAGAVVQRLPGPPGAVRSVVSWSGCARRSRWR